MTPTKRLLRHRLAACALLALFVGAGVQAQERKAYRQVDASGKVTYSQSPPADGKESKQVDISPAQRGRGGLVNDGGGYSAYDDPRYYAGQSARDRYRVTQRPSAQEQRYAELKAECERQRGTDCNNPATLRYLESTNQPSGRTVVRRPPTRAPNS